MGNPAGCSGAALLANQSQLEQSLTAESYPQGGLSSGPSYYCGGTWNGNNNWGRNYEGPIQVQNAEFCKVRCQASGGQCKGWTVTNNGECYLKDSVGTMRPDGGVQASGNC